jgi:hypothetical protein
LLSSAEFKLALHFNQLIRKILVLFIELPVDSLIVFDLILELPINFSQVVLLALDGFLELSLKIVLFIIK